MKAFIMITLLGLLFLALTGQAQDKPAKSEPPKTETKPVYKLDDNKPITINFSITIPVGYINGWLYVQQQGGLQAIQSSPQLSGAQITQLNRIVQAVGDTLNSNIFRQFNKFVEADKFKFTADTTEKFHPKIK